MATIVNQELDGLQEEDKDSQVGPVSVKIVMEIDYRLLARMSIDIDWSKNLTSKQNNKLVLLLLLLLLHDNFLHPLQLLFAQPFAKVI